MLKLALKITTLLLPLLLLAGYTEYRLRGLPNSYSLKLSRLESQAGQIRTLILGSSHAHHGIDPGCFELPAYNMANVSQSLYYDMKILQKELGRLPHLQVVVLPVSYFSLESPLFPAVEDWRCFFYEKFYDIPLPEEVNRRYPLTDFRRYSVIGLYGYPESRRLLLKKFAAVQLAEQIGADGWYPVTTVPGAEISDDSGKKRVAYHQGGMDKSLIPQNVAYLRTMIELLQKNGITAILVTPPVYATYSAYVDQASYTTLTRELSALSSRYGVSYRNYFRDPRFTRDDFFDNDHLSRSGAVKFSTFLNADIMGGLRR